jgi:hypothetical protein
MPLHLLPKKSWNVYAPANIERVKRDEAEARRKAIEREEQGRQNEANDRLEVLKQQSQKERKNLKRKLPGEDDTDRDIRLVLESAPTTTASGRSRQDHGSVQDADGHISLVPAQQKKSRLDKEQEKDPYTVYLTDATGRGQESKKTWYTSLQPQQEKWGDDNPRRQQREVARLNANDPLAAIKKGVKTLRDNEKARKEWMEQRERDLQEVEKLAKKQSHERKRRTRRDGNNDDLDSLDGFDLDGITPKPSRHHRDPDTEHENGSGRRRRHRHSDRDHKHRRGSHGANDHHRPSRRQETQNTGRLGVK